MLSRCRFVIIFFLLSLPAMGREAVPDIRVAIDVSGSMKKNDPKQLRTPALKLLVGLMPENMYSGVWTFGQYVNMEVKYGRVDTAWKNKARAAADRIHSKARFTNIEEAIQRASFNWSKADARYNRNLILLTDGKVDITRDQEVNQASRKRIVDYWIPRLQKAGVRVHTVALSKDVDQQLMTTLSGRTNGWYEQVDNAEQLQRVFLRLFEKSAKQDTVPLKGNRFTIDKNVSDMTLLVFRNDKSPELKINTPGGERWREQTAPGHVTWFHEDDYDLVTVKKPPSGVWVLETESDPDNRVMVVTNLRLKLNPLPDHMLLEESTNIEARLVDKEKTVTRRDFLKLVQFSLLAQREGEADGESSVLLDNGETGDKTANDGIYTYEFGKQTEAGLRTLIIRADGATFQRELRHTLHLHRDIAELKIEKETEPHQLTVKVNHFLLEPDSVKLALLNADEGVNNWSRKENTWSLPLPADFKQNKIEVKLSAKDRNAKAVEKVLRLEIHEEKAVAPEVSETEKEQIESKAADGEKHNDKAEKENDEKTEEQEASEEDGNWSMIIWLTVMINLILIIIGILVWILLKKRKAKALAQEDSEIKL